MRMIRWTTLLSTLAPLLLGCADGSDQQACYRIIESQVTESGARALAAVPCPGEERGLLKPSS
jgi:hypothetical protein